MAISRALKQAMKNRTQRSRRIEVLFFLGVIVMGLSFAGHPLRWADLVARAFLLIYVTVRIYRDWRWRKVLPVSSLDDRAMLEYGVAFERLDETQQQEILRRYRVGTYLTNYFPDEFDADREAEAHLRAYGVMKVLLPSIAVAYWAGWRLLPEGRLRAGWTDGPVVLTWILVLVLALPQMIQMWTQPDDVGEPLVASRDR